MEKKLPHSSTNNDGYGENMHKWVAIRNEASIATNQLQLHFVENQFRKGKTFFASPIEISQVIGGGRWGVQ